MLTIADVIGKVTYALGNVESNVDTLKSGHPQTTVKGIATTFMPSYEVLLQAANQDLNLVIAHEAPFYHHMDKVDFLEHNSVYEEKKAFIEKSGIAIFRLHDHMHRNYPDGIVDGLIQDLNWASYTVEPKVNTSFPLKTSPLLIPTMTLGEVANHVKSKLSLLSVRVIGDLSMRCSRVGILPGYTGTGELAIPFFQREDLDLIIVGEGPEWETPEYVRDALALGKNKALIIVGHEKSEESGMKYLAESIRVMFPSILVQFIAEKQLFQVV